MAHFSLLTGCPFRPEDIKLGGFDFQAHLPEGKKKDKDTANKKDKDTAKKKDDDPSHDAGPLPKIISISAFSRKVGHRSMGLQVAQVRLFIQRFPSEFRLMSMGRIVLPMKDGRAYVAEDGLPCPILSTVNAVKYLSTKYDDEKTEWNSQGKAQLQRVLSEGLQVQWVECDSFLEWQLMCDQADTQSQVQVQTHILDTAMKYLHYLRATTPAPATDAEQESSTRPDAASARGFEALFQGKGIHRFREAKQLLQSSEVEALVVLADWRKRVHYLHANALAQHYFVGATPWAALKGRAVEIDGALHALQSLVAQHVTSTICTAEILATSQETPRLKRSTMNITVFKELCDATSYGANYMCHLQNKYHMVWASVVSAPRLFRRALLQGEACLRQSFLRAFAAANRVESLDFETLEPGSDFALVIDKLNAAMTEFSAQAALAQAAPFRRHLVRHAGPGGPSDRDAAWGSRIEPYHDRRRRRSSGVAGIERRGGVAGPKGFGEHGPDRVHPR